MDKNFIQQMPKIDLHHHFDGAFPVKLLYDEAKRRNLPQGKLDFDTFKSKAVLSPNCRSLTEFLSTFEFFYDIAQNANFMQKAATTLVETLNSQNLIYCETRFAPFLFESPTTSVESIIEKVLHGLKAGQLNLPKEHSLKTINLILCLMRGAKPQQLEKLIDLAIKYKDAGVVAIDLAGDESKFPGEEYAICFDRAKKAGIKITIHAGEADGPSSVWRALKDFHCDRIGHGIQSSQDPQLIQYLKENKIPLEVCLTSNIQTATVKDYQNHPFMDFLSQGLQVTLNTDDPTVSGIDLSYEWQQAINNYSLTSSQVLQLLLNSVAASFANQGLKQSMKSNIIDFFETNK